MPTSLALTLALAIQAGSPAWSGGAARGAPGSALLAIRQPQTLAPRDSGSSSGAGSIALLGDPSAGAAAPVCLADICQASVSVPGFEPRWRDRRNELALRLLSRADIPHVSAWAAAIAATGITVEWSPGILHGQGPGGRTGWGRLMVAFRFKTDAPREQPSGP